MEQTKEQMFAKMDMLPSLQNLNLLDDFLFDVTTVNLEACKIILVMGDECTKIFLNTRGKNEDEVERTLVDFLHYVERSSDECVPRECDERLKHLHEIVKSIKASKQMGVTYMKMEERDRLIRVDGERRVTELHRQLITENRLDDLKKSVQDPKYQEKLLQEYGL